MSSLLLSPTVFAATPDIISSNNLIGIQAISTNVNYTETDSTGTLDTENGWVTGYALSLSMMKNWMFGNDYFEAEFDHSNGTTKYVGGLIVPPSTPYGSAVMLSGAMFTNYSGRYGTGIIVNDEFMLTPFFELGYHEWDRVSFGSTYKNDYWGLGALGQYSPLGNLVFSANAMAGTTFGGNIVSSSGFSGSLGYSIIYKAGISADYAYTQKLHFNIGADYLSFKYGNSAAKSIAGVWLYEPDSGTNDVTVKLGLGYAF